MPKSYREEGLPSKVREPPSTIHAFGGFTDESWNVSFNLVLIPCRGSGGCQNYSRTLLDVANSGSFLTRLR